MQSKILIINKAQFGYHTDYYKFCEYLAKYFDVNYFCFDTGNKKINIDNINVNYISYRYNKIFRGLRFILKAILTIYNFDGIILINYFENCQILKILFPKKKIILDIRTLSVNTDNKKRIKMDNKIKRSTKYFDHVTIISKELGDKLQIDEKKISVVPLGADIISDTKKEFSRLNLLYVGTLDGRNIYQTIEGLEKFMEKHSYFKEIKYDIIGDGKPYNDLKKLIIQKKLENIVTLYGRLPHFELQPFFDKNNIGVSYVPMTDYYQFQPPTKTYEYILSGMVCMATNTFENAKVINKENGILHEDNSESFANALEYIFLNRQNYNSDKIRNSLKDYTWENIVNKYLIPVFDKI